MGQRLVIVSFPLGGCVSFTPLRSSSVASALSLSESWLFLLLWICRCYCRIQWRRPSRKLLRFPWGLGLPVLSMVWVLIDFFPVFPWVFSPGLGRGSLSRVWLHRSGRLVTSGRPVSPLRSLAPSHSGVCAVRVGVPPLFPRSLRRALAYGHTVWPLPHSRWSRVHGRASAGLICRVSALWVSVCGATAPVGWLRGVLPCFAHLPYF